jgi:uncharacterized membrane protein
MNYRPYIDAQEDGFLYQPVLSVLVAFLGYTTLNVGQACQKIGLAKCRSRPRVGWTIWGFATLATSSAVLIVFVAVSLGSASLVGAMAGTGLASLAVFSRFVLKERMGRREVGGVALVLVGAALVGAFATAETGEAARPSVLVVLQLAFIAGYVAAWFLGGRRVAPGVVIGATSGMFSGFATLYQRLVSTSSTGLSSMVSNPANLIWIGMSVGAMAILQFAHGRGKAINIIPAHTANFVCVPILGGLLAFGESVTPMQWAGISLILAGVLLITVFAKRGTTAVSAATKAPEATNA